MENSVFCTDAIVKRFGHVTAVDGVTLELPQGRVMTLMGANGAGKTTLIQMLLGLLRPDGGSANVLGLDPIRDGTAIRRQVGYVPEVHHLYPWMRIGEVCRFVSAAYPSWDQDTCDELLGLFRLDPGKRIRGLSRGMTAKVALTLALAHRPSLLVLDEPTSGLDAAIRQEFLESLVGVVADGGRTVLISTHMLSEVERITECVAFMDRGQLRFVEDVETLKRRVREFRITFAEDPPAELDMPGILQATRHGHEWVVVLNDASEERIRGISARYAKAQVACRTMGLQEIFVALQRGCTPLVSPDSAGGSQ